MRPNARIILKVKMHLEKAAVIEEIKTTMAQDGSMMMEEKQDQKSQLIGMGVKLALSLAVLFPVYALLYVTFPASILGFYLISAVVFAAFAPWDDFKKKFMS